MTNDKKAVVYYPWSKEVLNDCILANNRGDIPALDLELTAKCTGACCIYCDSKPEVCAKGHIGELDYSTLEKVILEAKQRGLKWVYTCGLGEPLEDSKFWDMVSLFKNNDIKLSMFSNGVFIKDLETAKRLKEHNVNIILKMDTFDEEKFDAILGKKGTAKKIYQARDFLLEAGYGSKDNKYTDLAFSIVPTSLSIDSIPDVIEFCKKHGIFASVGELEQAGEVIKNNLSETLGIKREQVINLKKVADDYYDGSYMRPICPCIMSGLHIDNVGNCVVDKDTGLNCKWFLLKDPKTVNIGNVKNESVDVLFDKVTDYRKNAFDNHKEHIINSCSVSYVFGGCGGNPKDIIYLVKQQYE